MELLKAKKIQNGVKTLEDLKSKPFDLVTAPALYPILEKEHRFHGFNASRANLIDNIAKLIIEDMPEHALYLLYNALKKEKVKTSFRDKLRYEKFKAQYKADKEVTKIGSMISQDIYPHHSTEEDLYMVRYSAKRRRVDLTDENPAPLKKTKLDLSTESTEELK